MSGIHQKKRLLIWLKFGLIFLVLSLVSEIRYSIYLFSGDQAYLLEGIGRIIVKLIFYFIFGSLIGFSIQKIRESAKYLWLKLGLISVVIGILTDIYNTIQEVGFSSLRKRFFDYYADTSSLFYVFLAYLFYFVIGVVISLITKQLWKKLSVSKGKKASLPTWLRYGITFGVSAFILSGPLIYFMNLWGPFTDYHPIMIPSTMSLLLLGPITNLILSLFPLDTSLLVTALPMMIAFTIMYFIIGSFIGFVVQLHWPKNIKLKTGMIMVVLILMAYGLVISLSFDFSSLFEKSQTVGGYSIRTSHISEDEVIKFVNLIVDKGLEQSRILSIKKVSDEKISFDYEEAEDAECMPFANINDYDGKWHCTYSLEKTAQGWSFIDPNKVFF